MSLDRTEPGAGRATGPLRLSVVVPTWNAPQVLAPHLPGLLAEAGSVAGGAEVIVVDDGSNRGQDETAGVVAAAGPRARLLRLDGHVGFAAACNAGARAAAGDALMLLNSDMEVEAGCLARLLAVLDGRPEVFAVTPVIVNLEGAFPESSTRVRFHRGVFDVVQPGRAGVAPPAIGELREVAFACGGALMCRRAAFLDVGGFSTLYEPFYWEDVDLSWRARRSGLTMLEAGGARVLHEHARTIRDAMPPAGIGAVYERNRLLFTWVHLDGAGGWARHLAWFVPRVVAALLRRDPAWRGQLAALGRLRAARAQRRALHATRDRAAELTARAVGGVP